MNAKDSFRDAWNNAAIQQGLRKRTIKVYWFWTRRFFVFCGKRASVTWNGEDWIGFERSLVTQSYSVSAIGQARCTVNFLFCHVLKRDVGHLGLPKLKRVKGTTRTIPAREELEAIFGHLSGRDWLMCQLMYGSLLRVGECCKLRVKDIDFANGKIDIFDGKGGKNRKAWLPRTLVEPLRQWIEWRAGRHAWDVAQGNGCAPMPGRLAVKYPSRSRELGWQYLFPSKDVKEDGCCWHATEKSIQKAVAKARRDAGVLKDVTPHTFRHAGATHGLRTPGNDIEVIRGCLGHANLETTQIYIHADDVAGVSPLDAPLLRPAVMMPLPKPGPLLLPHRNSPVALLA